MEIIWTTLLNCASLYEQQLQTSGYLGQILTVYKQYINSWMNIQGDSNLRRTEKNGFYWGDTSLFNLLTLRQTDFYFMVKSG